MRARRFSNICGNNTSPEQAQGFPCPALLHVLNNHLTEALLPEDTKKNDSQVHAHTHTYCTQILPFDPSASKIFLKRGKTKQNKTKRSQVLASDLPAFKLNAGPAALLTNTRDTTRLELTQVTKGDHTTPK